MDGLPFTHLDLVAIDPERNMRRRWGVVASYDLFGQIMVETRWGRIGTCGQRTVRSFTDERQALRYVRALLARRRTAVRRLGVEYVAGL